MSVRPGYAVLFALPTDRATFDAVVRGEVLQDYRGLLIRGEPPEHVWNRRYERVAAAAQELIRVAEDLGATTTTRATLADITSSSESNQVVIIIGHWRGWTVSEADLRADAHEIVRRLSHAGLGDLVSLRETQTSRRTLARDLNAAIEGGQLLTRTNSQLAETVDHPTLRAALGRDVLDELLEGVIDPGNGVELCDGLHSPAEFEAAIHPSFQGDLDLATCSSVVLATLISMRRGRSVKVVHTLDLVDPLMCMIAITATLRRLKTEGGTYGGARLDIESQVAEVRRQLKSETQRR